MKAAYAHTNIALVKYWGKRALELNLPATGSLSLTLDRFGTHTAVERIAADADELVLDGAVASAARTARVSAFVDRVRRATGDTARVRVTSRNDVPTAAGLASSASAFAALAMASAAEFGLEMDAGQLSGLARQGSGSASRSLFGGFAQWDRGEADDGADSIARAVRVKVGFDVRLIVVRCGEGEKPIGSTEGMVHTAKTSPYYPAWVDTHAADLDEARAALAAGDLEKLGDVMEFSTLKMHACALTARPGFWYLKPPTVAVLDTVKALRAAGAPVWFTMDAGPHVKVLTTPEQADAMAAKLAAVPGVRGVDVAAPGPAAHLVDAAPTFDGEVNA